VSCTKSSGYSRMIRSSSSCRRPCEVVLPICSISPAAFMVNSISRCSRQSTKLCTCIRSKRGTPHLRRECAICSRPSPPVGVQTLSAANTDGHPSFARPWPTVSWDEPYMGEESITVPPAAKKAPLSQENAGGDDMRP